MFVLPHATHLLVVEDDASLRELIALRLERLGHETTAVASVSAAIEALEHEHVDGILSDYLLPGATGLALLAYVRRARLDVPFVLMSGVVEPQLRGRALASGADAVYEKGEILGALPHAFDRVPAAA